MFSNINSGGTWSEIGMQRCYADKVDFFSLCGVIFSVYSLGHFLGEYAIFMNNQRTVCLLSSTEPSDPMRKVYSEKFSY